MRKTLGACSLVLLLAYSASAGIIQNETPAPAPTPATTAQEPTTDGEMQNDAADSLTQIALDLLAVLPSLF